MPRGEKQLAGQRLLDRLLVALGVSTLPGSIPRPKFVGVVQRVDRIVGNGRIPDYSSRKHKMSKRARHVESDQRVTGYPQKTAETRPG